MSESASEQREVSPLELFFDLVFAFAVSQLSHHLWHDQSWRGAVETLVLLVAVFTVWLHTSWTVTMLPERTDTSRMLLSTMALGLWMNAALPSAFGNAPWPFVVTLSAIQLGRTLWTIAAVEEPVFRFHFIRVLVWLMIATPLWVTGALAEPTSRMHWWAAAAGMEVVGNWFAHPLPGHRLHSESLPFDAGHMLERCNLFVLIALGEALLAAGSGIAQQPSDGTTLLTGLFAFAETAALWALAYGRAYNFAREHPERARNPVRLSHYALNAVTVMVAGLIVVAVVNQDVLAKPTDRGSLMLALMLGGGPMLFLVAQASYVWTLSGTWPRVRIAGAAAAFLVGLCALVLRAQIAFAAVTACVSALALVDGSTRRPLR